MKFRIDIGDVHGYIVGAFMPDDEDTVVWNDNTPYREIAEQIRRATDVTTI